EGSRCYRTGRARRRSGILSASSSSSSSRFSASPRSSASSPSSASSARCGGDVEPDVASSTVRVVTVFGIPISVDASWILIYALIAWSLAVGYFPIRLPGLEPAAYWDNGLLAEQLLFVSVLLL